MPVTRLKSGASTYTNPGTVVFPEGTLTRSGRVVTYTPAAAAGAAAPQWYVRDDELVIASGSPTVVNYDYRNADWRFSGDEAVYDYDGDTGVLTVLQDGSYEFQVNFRVQAANANAHSILFRIAGATFSRYIPIPAASEFPYHLDYIGTTDIFADTTLPLVITVASANTITVGFEIVLLKRG